MELAASLKTQTASTADLILQRILETARECMLVVGNDLRISSCNVPAAVAFGREGLDLEGRRLSEIIRDPELHSAFQRALADQISSDVRIELNRPGKRRFDVHIAPIELNGGRSSIGFFYETTQIDRLESVRQEFLSNISHELRTPLTSILTFVETLEEGGIDDVDNSRHFLSIIRRNAERMRTLIADILELSMIESGNVSVDLRPTRVRPIVEDVFAALDGSAKVRSIELLTDIGPDVSLVVDHGRLEQMLTNLIDNAIKFNRDNGSVKVTYKNENEKDVVCVSDTGEGLMPEHSERIFERFYRTDRARSREIGGTGLGLAIVKHLTRLHGGEVSVHSVLGSGTTFCVELPADAPRR